MNVRWSLHLSLTLKKTASGNNEFHLDFYFYDNIFMSFMPLLCSPESYTVKIDHHPLGRVEDQWIGIFDTLQWPAQLWTQIRRRSVRGINVEPQFVFCACVIYLTSFNLFNRTKKEWIVSGMKVKTYRLVPVQTDCQMHRPLLFPKLGKPEKRRIMNNLFNICPKKSRSFRVIFGDILPWKQHNFQCHDITFMTAGKTFESNHAKIFRQIFLLNNHQSCCVNHLPGKEQDPSSCPPLWLVSEYFLVGRNAHRWAEIWSWPVRSDLLSQMKNASVKSIINIWFSFTNIKEQFEVTVIILTWSEQ